MVGQRKKVHKSVIAVIGNPIWSILVGTQSKHCSYLTIELDIVIKFLWPLTESLENFYGEV